MKTRVRRISGGKYKVSAKTKENVGGLMVVDGTEVSENRGNQLAVEVNLERGIAKLKDEHRQVLTILHAEVDKLKRQNQELQLLVAFNDVQMLERDATAAGGHTRLQTGRLTNLQGAAIEKGRVHSAKGVTARNAKGELQPASTANQTCKTLASGEVSQSPSSLRRQIIAELKRNLKEEKCRNIGLLDKLSENNAKKMSHESGIIVTQGYIRKSHPNIKRTSKRPDTKSSCPLPFDAKLEPFLVHNNRPPTAEECEVIIKALKERVDKQSNEINSIKTDLKDVIEKHKLTPESFLLAKYYSQETSVPTDIVKVTCNQRKSSGSKPAVVSLPNHGQLPAEKLDHKLRKSGFLFKKIICRPLVL